MYIFPYVFLHSIPFLGLERFTFLVLGREWPYTKMLFYFSRFISTSVQKIFTFTAFLSFSLPLTFLPFLPYDVPIILGYLFTHSGQYSESHLTKESANEMFHIMHLIQMQISSTHPSSHPPAFHIEPIISEWRDIPVTNHFCLRSDVRHNPLTRHVGLLWYTVSDQSLCCSMYFLGWIHSSLEYCS